MSKIGLSGNGRLNPRRVTRQDEALASELADQHIRYAMNKLESPQMANGRPVNNKFMGNDGREYGWAQKNGKWIAVPWGSVAGTGRGQLYGPGY